MTTATAKRMNKLYEGLSAEDLGTLAVEACLKGNEAEIKQIKATVTKAVYRQPVIEYEKRAETLERVINFIGIQYWLHTAHFLMSKSDDRLDAWEDQLINLIQFFWRVCEATQLDFRLALNHLYINEKLANAFKELPANEELVDEWMEMLDL